MDVIVNREEQKLQALSADPETRREYERREKALSDERSRMDDARASGILLVVKSLIQNGMSLEEAAKHTPYSTEELREILEERG